MQKEDQINKVKRLTPKPETLKRLFALSGNQCAFPQCSNTLFTSKYTFVAEVAHIEAAMPDGERFNPLQTNEQRRAYTNLIALCRIHHVETNDVDAFPVPVLQKMKADHEQRFLTKDSTFDVPDSAISELHSILTSLNESVMEIKEDVSEIKSVASNTNETVNKMFAIMSAQQGESNALEDEYNRQLQEIIQDIDKGLVQRSLSRLLSLKSNTWKTIQPTLKYNILTQTAVCYHQLEDHQKTIEVIIEAYKIRPETAPALANIVNAYMAIDDYGQASHYLDIFKDKFPDSNVAVGLEIKLKSANKPLEELLLEIPEDKLEDPEILLSISMAAMRQADLSHSLTYLTKLYQMDGSQHIYQQMLLQTILNLLSEDFALTNLQIISQESRELLNLANELIDKLLHYILNSEMFQVKGRLFTAKGYVYGMLKEYSKATSYLEKSLEISPDNQHAIKLLGIFHSRQKQWLSAINEWEKISDYTEFPDLPAMIAEAYAKNGELEKGIPILEKFLETAPDSYFRTQSIHALLDFYINADRKAEVISYIAENFKDQSIPSFISLARASNYLDQPDEAEHYLTEANRMVDQSTKYKDILFLAEEMIVFKRFDNAAELFEKIAIKSQESQITAKLYRLYHTIGQTGKALAIMEELRKANGPLRNATSLEIRIYQQLGNYPKVIELGEEYLAIYNDDELMRIIMAGNYLRENRREKAEEMLSFQFNISGLEINSQYTLLAQLDTIGQRPRLFEIAYEYLRSEDSLSSNELFISIFLNYPVITEVSDPELVALDTCVHLSNELPADFFVILEDRDQQGLLPFEVIPGDPRYSALIGKKVGDQVAFDKYRTWQVTRIQHKYVHTYFECKRKIDTVFSEKSHFRSFRIEDEIDRLKGIKDDGNLVFSFQDGISACQNNQLSFAGLAAIFDKNPLELREIFNAVDAEFLSTTGSLDETANGFEEQIQSKRLCADITALMFMAELGLSAEIIDTFGKILITHSTYDLIFDAIEQARSLSPNGVASEQLENLLLFINEVSEKLFPDHLVNINGLDHHEAELKFGRSFYHTRLLCQIEGYILWSDDYLFRKEVVDTDGTHATWTHHILLYMMVQGVISSEVYERKSLHLLNIGYQHTSINATTLFRAYTGYDGMPQNSYQKCIDVLNGVTSDLVSAISVAYFFLLKVQTDTGLKERDMELLIFDILMEVSKNRELRKVISGFKMIMRERTSNGIVSPDLALGMKIMKQIKKISDTYFS